MKKHFKLFMLIFLCFPLKIFAISTSARCAILMDTDSNRILYAENIHEVRSVASISKIMTAVLATESGKLDEKVVVGDEILSAYGSAIYIKVGEELTLRDLVYGLMLRSGNDAALAIAKYVGGDVDTFVQMMNEKAKQIGMKNTTFNNPSGLDEEKGNMSTALNLVVVTLNDGNDFSDHKSLFEYGFENYVGYNILSKGNINIYDDTYYKNEELYITKDFKYPLLETEKDNIKLKFELEQKRNINDNDPVGKVKVLLGDKEIYEDNVYVKEKKISTKVSFLEKIGKWFKNLW